MSPCSSSVSCHITECDGAKQWNFSSDCGTNPEKHTHSQQTQIRMCARALLATIQDAAATDGSR